MLHSVETVCSNNCWEVRRILDTKADRMHLKPEEQAFTAMLRQISHANMERNILTAWDPAIHFCPL